MPQRQSPDDPHNVQHAVNQASPGDTIVLGAGVFDFGDFETVIIPKDLTIEGAWDTQNHIPLTTIQGGLIPLTIGRKTRVPKPATRMVNGQPVWHVTQDIYGKLTYPFLYPPYFEPGTGQVGAHYNILDDWTAVDASVRQITFQRPYGAAIFTSGMQGGTIERCRFISAWPWQAGFEGINPMGMGIQIYNLAARPLVAAELGVLYDPLLYTDTALVRGDIVVQDNVILGDWGEVWAGDTDENGHAVIVPFAGNPAPPENDYANYVLQDVFQDDWAPLNSQPASAPRTYWVRKGYSAGWWDDQSITARRGMAWSIACVWTEATLKIENNVIRNSTAGVVLGWNGAMGKPFNALVRGNTITTQFCRARGSMAVWANDTTHENPFTHRTLVPDPGAGVSIENNDVDLHTAPGSAGLDIAVCGQVRITDNQLTIDAGNGIAFNPPTRNGLAQGNRIAGTGYHAFLAMPGSTGNQFVENDVTLFKPTGMGAVPCPDGNTPSPSPQPARAHRTHTHRQF
jgi:hypothetical protein